MERGYVKLWRSFDQNELLDNDNNALVVFIRILTDANRLTGTYTTGRNKFAAVCNLKPTTLYGVLKRLESSSIIRLQSDRNSTTITICNWWKYQQDTDKKSSPARSSDDTIQEKKKKENIDTKVSNSMALSKPKIKSSEIDEMFSKWEEIAGFKINGQAKMNRYACSNLLKKYGATGLTQLIEGVKLAQLDKYAPTIADFSSLQAKQNDLIAWGKKKQLSGMKKVVSI